VQQRNTVRPLRYPQAHECHVEDGRVATGRVLGAKGEHPIDRQAKRIVGRAEVMLDQPAREPVDAGGYRRMGGEQRR
jgi:hypothetical protein